MAANDNPYLALLQQEQKPPGWAEILQHVANLGFGMAGGLGQAASQGGSTIGGLGTGLILGNQLNAQQAQRAEQERMKRIELQFKAQEHEDKRAEMIRKEDQLKTYLNMPGFQAVAPPGPLMGPGGTPTTGTPTSGAPGPDLKTGGAPLVDYLVAQHGLSPLAASTVVGNLYQESSFNPSATGDSGSAFGLAQWRLDRQTGLRNFAATQNKPVTDPQVQIDYLVSEMRGGDMGAQRAYAGLQQAKTPEQANAAMMHFFRPAGYTPANPTGGLGYDRRVANTRALLPQDRPFDQATAPVPTVDPYAVSAPPSGPAPRPGLGPRATPQTEPATDGVPVAQGGGEGEVVLPRIGLPFPARPPAAAPPGSVPFPTISAAPGGPVQPNYTPTQPGMVPQTPAGTPAPAGANPPPVFTPPARVPVPPEVARHFKGLAAAGLITVGQAEKSIEDYGENLNKQVHESAREQYKAQVQIWQQREQVAVEQRKIQAQVEAEQRAVAQKDKEHARSREEEGDWIRQNGVMTFVPKKDIKPGMMKEDTPKEPPAPGTAAGDDHILSTVDRGSVEYRDAYNRQRSTPHVINGQAYVRDMTKVPPPTYGQPAGAPAPSAAPAAAPASKPSEVPGMTPVGEKNYTQEQGREHKFVSQIDNAIPKLLEQITDKDGNYTSKNLPSSVDIGLALNSYIPDAFVGNKARRYRQTVKDIVTATLRDTSGATIGKPEFTDDMQKYIPMAGDDADTIKQKVEALKVFSTAMAAGTGRPIDQYPTIKSFSEPITVDKSGKRL